jgi:hypothetical protein
VAHQHDAAARGNFFENDIDALRDAQTLELATAIAVGRQIHGYRWNKARTALGRESLKRSALGITLVAIHD